MVAAHNLTNEPQAVAFADLADVKGVLTTSFDDGEQDAALTNFITQLSKFFTGQLGMHTLRATYTETYELRPRTGTFSLTGTQLLPGEPFSIKLATRVRDLVDATELTDEDYTLGYPSGEVRLYSPVGKDPCYAEVTYTGGLATNTAGLRTSFPDLHQAMLIQVRYLNERLQSLGSNISSPAGGTTSYSSAYNIQPAAKSILMAHRRSPML